MWIGNGTTSILNIREGVTQGDTLEMIAYRIGILPIIKKLEREIPDVTQPWYADDSRSLVKFVKMETYFD